VFVVSVLFCGSTKAKTLLAKVLSIKERRGTLPRLEFFGSEGVSTQRKTAAWLHSKGMAAELIGRDFDRSCAGNPIHLGC
jgi:hypothetical protein